METKEFYIEKAKELIEKAKLVKGEYDENDIFSYPEMKDLSRELIHLIYSYDKTLPLLDEAKGLMEISFSGISVDNHSVKLTSKSITLFVNISFITLRSLHRSERCILNSVYAINKSVRNRIVCQ